MAGSKLKPREKVVVAVGTVVLLLIGITPLAQRGWSAYERSEALVEESRDRFQLAQEWQIAIEEERAGQKAIRDQLRRRPPRFDLYSFTNLALREEKLQERATLNTESLNNPALDGVLVELRGISMKQLVDFLHRLYDSGNLIVVQKVDHLRPANDGNGLDLRMTLMSPRTGG